MTNDSTSTPPEPVPEASAAAAEHSRWNAAGQRFLSALRATRVFHPEEWPLRTMIGTAVAVALILFALALARHGFAHVKESEVGVLADNLKDELILKSRVGYHFFLPYAANFYVLDKKIQKLSLTWDQGPGTQSGRDVKLKTVDGNNVSLDITISYKLIPEKAVEVLRSSGTGMQFGETWVEPFARHSCFATFGQLTTEELYDAAKRNKMAQAAQDEMNATLTNYGIEVIAVLPGDFRFYREYEQVIQEKKLADQEVEEQQAQARAAMEDQDRQIIVTRKEVETRLATFEGDSTNKLIQAQAEAARLKREGEGQSKVTMLTADSALYSTTQQAAGRRATLLAEADGMKQQREAMSGDGGASMVALEYAKRLNSIHFAGTAVLKQPVIQQLSVQPGEAAAATQGGAR